MATETTLIPLGPDGSATVPVHAEAAAGVDDYEQLFSFTVPPGAIYARIESNRDTRYGLYFDIYRQVGDDVYGEWITYSDGPDDTQAVVDLYPIEGETYTIWFYVWLETGSFPADFTLSVATEGPNPIPPAPPNNTKAGAIDLGVLSSGSQAYDNAGAVYDPDDDNWKWYDYEELKSVWFKFRVDAISYVTFDFEGPASKEPHDKPRVGIDRSEGTAPRREDTDEFYPTTRLLCKPGVDYWIMLAFPGGNPTSWTSGTFEWSVEEGPPESSTLEGAIKLNDASGAAVVEFFPREIYPATRFLILTAARDGGLVMAVGNEAEEPTSMEPRFTAYEGPEPAYRGDIGWASERNTGDPDAQVIWSVKAGEVYSIQLSSREPGKTAFRWNISTEAEFGEWQDLFPNRMYDDVVGRGGIGAGRPIVKGNRFVARAESMFVSPDISDADFDAARAMVESGRGQQADKEIPPVDANVIGAGTPTTYGTRSYPNDTGYDAIGYSGRNQHGPKYWVVGENDIDGENFAQNEVDLSYTVRSWTYPASETQREALDDPLNPLIGRVPRDVLDTSAIEWSDGYDGPIGWMWASSERSAEWHRQRHTGFVGGLNELWDIPTTFSIREGDPSMVDGWSTAAEIASYPEMARLSPLPNDPSDTSPWKGTLTSYRWLSGWVDVTGDATFTRTIASSHYLEGSPIDQLSGWGASSLFWDLKASIEGGVGLYKVWPGQYRIGTWDFTLPPYPTFRRLPLQQIQRDDELAPGSPARAHRGTSRGSGPVQIGYE